MDIDSYFVECFIARAFFGITLSGKTKEDITDIFLKNIDLLYGKLLIFKSLSVHFETDTVTAVLGPSGCGKTSLLNLVSGSIQPDTGQVKIKDDKRISYIFQEPRLLPWKTVGENINFVLKHVFNKTEREKIINHYLSLVKMGDFKNFYPNELSGGMKQRTSIVRAFAFPSDILLMDEPFQALDLDLKYSLIEVFRNLWNKDHRTTIFVTHNISEALLLGNRIIVMGNAPDGIRETFPNPLREKSRFPGSSELLTLESELYQSYFYNR
ncbi:MAG: ABC transporter ATP-binding protein [Spirochaetes bacterium]|nr:MAG: ABC transporter ATP-binding protein [Spirochaetota bacterium]